MCRHAVSPAGGASSTRDREQRQHQKSAQEHSTHKTKHHMETIAIRLQPIGTNNKPPKPDIETVLYTVCI